MKRLFLAIFFAVFAMVAAISVSAEDGAPTYSFDTSLRTMDFEVFGTGEDMGISFSISRNESVSGSSLEIKANCETTLEDDFGGIWISADKLGLENFAGCKVSLSYMIDPGYAEAYSFLQMFSTTPEWDQTDIGVALAGRWMTCELEIPENHANVNFGIKIPITGAFSGRVMYIDNIYVYDAEGNLLENVDGYIEPEETVTTAATTRASEVTYITSEVETQSEGSGAIVIAIIAVVVVAVAAVIVVVIIRRRSRFY